MTFEEECPKQKEWKPNVDNGKPKVKTCKRREMQTTGQKEGHFLFPSAWVMAFDQKWRKVALRLCVWLESLISESFSAVSFVFWIVRRF